MGTYYLLGCHDCKKHLHVAKSFAGSDPHLEVEDVFILKFLLEHEGHTLGFETGYGERIINYEEIEYG